MDDARALNRKYETIAWGAFFIWLGITNLFHGLPQGVGAVGIGILLLGLNLARYVSKIPTSGVTIFLGALALVLGLFDVARAVLRLEIDLPFFPLLLIVIGVVWLVRGITRSTPRAS
ncbi:MAG: hypothetical protein L0Y55_06145 [Anaerolineales bacterium]|nr:hypothetical protein [Anaerolineales bacterium]